MAGQRINRRVAHVSEAPPPNDVGEAAAAPTTAWVSYVGPARPGVIIAVEGQPLQVPAGNPVELPIATAERLLMQPSNWAAAVAPVEVEEPPAPVTPEEPVEPETPVDPEIPEAPADPVEPETPDATGPDGGA